MVKAWFIVAVMTGVYSDGTKDIFIFEQPKDHGHFHTSAMCQKYIGDNPFKLVKALVREYGKKEGEKVFYAARNKGTIKGVERANKGKLMRGKNKKPEFIVMIAIGEKKKKKTNKKG